MRMLSGRMHWLTVGLALLLSAGWTTQTVRGQMPGGMPPGMGGMPPGGMGVMPAGGMGAMPGGMGMMGPDAPMSMAFPGPAPGEVVYASGCSSCGGGGCDGCDSGCDSMGGGGGCSCGGGGLFGRCRCSKGGGLFGGGSGGGSGGGNCQCSGLGCGLCGNGTLFNGRLASLLGPLAPYSEGSRAAQRWFDVYAGTMALARTSDVGGVSTGFRDATTGAFFTRDVISQLGNGTTGTPALAVSDLDFNKIRYGLELIANVQTGVGSNVEVRYFGLNNWTASQTARSTVPQPGVPNLFSIFSLFGDSPAGGFDDTDRSLVHTISYNSELHNGEVNFRRRWVSAFDWAQGSFLFGIRYFDLDERFGFNAIGSNNNTFTFDQLRFFDYNVKTRNQLTGVQAGGDLWANIAPGIHLGVEGKAGIYGNHAEVESLIVANSVPGAREFLQDGKTAFLTEFSASAVYRLSYSLSLRGSYNILYVDNVALAPENFNTRDFSNALGSSRSFTMNRFPFLDVKGDVLYQGFSAGVEWMW